MRTIVKGLLIACVLSIFSLSAYAQKQAANTLNNVTATAPEEIVGVTNQDNGGDATLSYVTDDLLRATSFTTGPESTLLVSAELKVSSRNEIGVEMTFTATVYDNTISQLPGNVVGVFDDLLFSQSVANQFEDATFVSNGIVLQPNTKYWLALGGYGGDGGDYIATTSDTDTSTVGWTIGNSDLVTLIAPDTWLQTGGANPVAFTLNIEHIYTGSTFYVVPIPNGSAAVFDL